MSVQNKETTLAVRWSKKEQDLVVFYPINGKRDGNLVCNVLASKRHHPIEPAWSDSLVEELSKRGYDTTTLKFSIKKLKTKET